jgi:hypothetical protein
MGEAKRRKEILGDDYGKDEPIVAWIPFWTKQNAKQFIELSSKAAWVGIGLMIAAWITIRFIGPALGWWQLVD